MSVKHVYVHVTGPKTDPLTEQFEREHQPQRWEEKRRALEGRMLEEEAELDVLLNDGYAIVATNLIDVRTGQCIVYTCYKPTPLPLPAVE